MHSAKSSANTVKDNTDILPHNVRAINSLPTREKREVYTRLIPTELLERFQLSPDLINPSGEDLLALNCPTGSTLAEMALYHQVGFPWRE